MAKAEEIIRFTVSLPLGLLKQLDRRVGKKGYASRSEFVRDLIREQIVETKWTESDTEVFGVLTIGYDHHQRGLTQKIVDAQHSAYVNILCSTHVHLDHHHCLEAIIIKGRPRDIEAIRTRIGGIKGVEFAKLSKASTVEI